MAHLIRFTDNVLVEVAQNPDPVTPVAGKSAERMSQAFQSAAEVVASIIRGVVGATSHALRDAGAEEASIEFGVGFSLEGNVYVTKATGEGNVKVQVKINGSQT